MRSFEKSDLRSRAEDATARLREAAHTRMNDKARAAVAKIEANVETKLDLACTSKHPPRHLRRV